MRILAGIALIVIGIVVCLTLAKIREIIGRHGIHNIIGRMVTLRPHHGKRKSDATFFRGSTEKASGKSRGRHHRAGYVNLLITMTVLSAVIATGYGLFVARSLTEFSAGMGAVMTVAVYSYVGVRMARRWHRNRTMVTPLAVAAERIIDPARTMGTHPNYLINMEPDWATKRRGVIGELILPDAFHANEGQRQALENLITARMPRPVTFTWQTSKMPQKIIFNALPPMPAKIPFSDVLPAIRRLPADSVLVGYTAEETAKTWDMGSEEPMMFVSATTRRGKTTMAMLLMAQILNKGGSVTAIDPKAIGLDTFCAGHPNAKVYADNTDVASMWTGIHEFRMELNDRIEAFKKDRTLTFPRKTLFLDEISVFNMMSIAHWMQIKPSKARNIPPVWDDIMAIIFMGAQFNTNCCVFGQRVDFRTLGGLIDGFGTRLLAGYDQKTYMRLVGILPTPRSQKTRGRFLYFNNGDDYPVWVQVPYGSIQELRDYAMESVGRQLHAPTVAEIVEVTESRKG